MVNKSWKSFVENKLTIFLKEIESEWKSQDLKFPNQIHTLEKWLVIVMEEIGEMSKECLELESKDYNLYHLYNEIIQAITLLIRIRYSVYKIDLLNKEVII